MREFLSLMVNPLPVLSMLLLAGIIFIIANHKKTGKIFLVIAGIWFLVIITPTVPRALVRSLENRYKQISDSSIKNIPDSSNIIVLGGGHSDDKNLSPNNQLTAIALARLTEGIRIHRMIPGSRLILSGYRGRSELPQALVLYNTAQILGIDTSSMYILPFPSNTQMEAKEYAKKFGTKNNPIIVTSDIHMPRAMMLFREAGFTPIAAPANPILKYGSAKNPWRWIPSTSNTEMMKVAIHEYVGILWAKTVGE